MKLLLNLSILLLVLATAGVLAALSTTAHTRASDNGLALTVRPTVVPLPTVAPLPTAAPAQISQPPQHTGGYIQLYLPAALCCGANTANVRAAVQWQGPPGTWHTVEGWQSQVDSATVRWWVAPADFGKGPFRWVIHRGNPAQPVAVSASFYLPRWLGDEVAVDAGL